MEVVKEALYKTVVITAMILLILITGNMFAGVFSATGGMVGVSNYSLLSGINELANNGDFIVNRFYRWIYA